MYVPVKLNEVKLRIFDLSKGYVDVFRGVFDNDERKGIWHTNVCAFGNEYFYRNTICICNEGIGWPDDDKLYEVISIGYTKRTVLQLEAFLRTVQCDFTAETYDIFEHNCNHFSNLVVDFLIKGQQIPRYILKLPEYFLNNSIGKIIKTITYFVFETFKHNNKGVENDESELAGKLLFYGTAHALTNDQESIHILRNLEYETVIEKLKKESNLVFCGKKERNDLMHINLEDKLMNDHKTILEERLKQKVYERQKEKIIEREIKEKKKTQKREEE